MSEVNYRQQWAEGEIEAGTLLDAIDTLGAERDQLRAELSAIRAQKPAAMMGWGDDGVWTDGDEKDIANAGCEGFETRTLYAAPPLASAWVPEGWRLVPAEPTEAMVDAGCREHTCVQGDSWYSDSEISEHDAIDVFKAMLAAAPTPGASDGE